MAEFGFEFWKRVDELRYPSSLSEFSKKVGVPYQTLLNQRSECRYPKRDDISKIASALHTSIDYLMTGKKTEAEPSCPEAEAVKESPELQALVRAMTKDPKLLQVVAAIIEK